MQHLMATVYVINLYPASPLCHLVYPVSGTLFMDAQATYTWSLKRRVNVL